MQGIYIFAILLAAIAAVLCLTEYVTDWVDYGTHNLWMLSLGLANFFFCVYDIVSYIKIYVHG